MNQHKLDTIDGSTYDVVICGGGLAGLTLARQLRREQPEVSILLLEKTSRPLPPGCHKVGESSVELGSNYFERIGLRDYLRTSHLIKHGLRFFPGGGQTKSLEERFEIGPVQEPIVPSYQIDRGTFESDLRGFLEDDGVVLVEGAMVRDIDLKPGEEPHKITFEAKEGDAKRSVTAFGRWAVDATGRNAILRRKLKLTRGSPHSACAGWFRVEGRIDINKFVPESCKRWHEKEHAGDRWRSTNHLMGPGYWVWIIPLSSGLTSIGAVVHTEIHPFETVRTLERTRAFIEKYEPQLAKELAPYEALDFLCLNDFSHQVGRCWSPDRWAMVGEAGAFVDPLYSPGSDFIAYANTFTGELIRIDREGGELETKARDFNLVYRALVSGNIDVYRQSAPVYGHPRGMLAKVYWDNFAYWSYSCQYYMRKIYRLSGSDAAPFIAIGQRFIEISNYMQKLLREWALIAPEEPEAGFAGMPRFPSVLVDAHLALRDDMNPAQTLEYMQKRLVEGEEIAAEFIVRIMSELGDEKARELVERTQLTSWRLSIEGERLEAEPTIGLARRRALTPIARDVERSLGRVTPRTSEATMRALLAPILDSEVRPLAPVAPEQLADA